MRWLIFATLAAWLLWRFFSTVGAWIDYPYPRGGPEGRVYHETLLIKSGTSIYDPITPDRFISGASPPLYYLPSLLVTPAGLPDFSMPDSVTSAFAPARALSLLAALLTAVLLVALIVFDAAGRFARAGRQARLRSWAWAAPAAVLFLSLPPVLVWSATLGGEMFAMTLTVGGLLCVAAGVRARSEGQEPSREPTARYALLVVGAVLFALAFLTEQRTIAGPVASLVFLGVRDWRLGLKWGALVAALIALPVLLLDLLTGHWFYLKLVDYHDLPLRRINLERLLQNGFLEDQWPLVLTALLASGYFIYQAARAWRAGRAHDLSLIAIFLPVTLLLMPFGVSQSSDHHALLLPGIAVCAAVGALFAHRVGPTGEKRGNRSMLAADGAIAMVAVYAILTSAPSSMYGPDLALPTAAENGQMRATIQYLRDDPNPHAFSDDPGIVALAGKMTSYNDPAAMTALSEKGGWDETAYRDKLRAGELGLLALSCDATASPTNCRSQTFSPGVLASIRDGYTLLFRDIFSTYGAK